MIRLAAAAAIVWRFASGAVTGEGADTAYPVGSLQKAWVLKAWAASHPESTVPLPRIVCDRSSRCWLAGGHGALGLRRATALSCNAYFRRLASETPAAARRDALLEAGFEVPETVSPDLAIGLDSHGERVTITPRQLLHAYADLVRAPWIARDDTRREWLDGMRDAGEDGTASALARRGLLAKTGTVAAVDGTPLATSGWALALDPAGRSAALLLLPRGTGTLAARSLGERLAREEPSAAARAVAATTKVRPRPAAPARHPDADVRVRLFVTLRHPVVKARNLSGAPLRRESTHAAEGWVGPGVTIPLEKGVMLGSGTWELTAPTFGLVRVVEGGLERSASGTIVLTSKARDYVEGVLLGELPRGGPERREELAAAVLRFLARGPRHGTENVCDISHCERFLGRGPEVSWPSPTKAVLQAAPARGAPPALDDASWSRALAASRREGPFAFTTHCGGEPLSPHALWGLPERSAPPCPRHHGGTGLARWSRTWKDDDLAAVFGGRVTLQAAERDGVRMTLVTAVPFEPADPPPGSPHERTERRLLYDSLHRLLAPRLGWDALPSPPDRFTRVEGGWRVDGRGSGHRVGLCLTD